MSEPSKAARDVAKRLDFEPCDHVKTTDMRKLDCLDCMEKEIQRAIDDAEQQAYERFMQAINPAINAAVSAERERCATVADDYDGDGHDHEMYTQLGNSVLTQNDIAKLIRALPAR